MIIDISAMAMLAVETKTKRSLVKRCGEISLVLDQQAVSDLAQLPPLHIAAFDKRSLSTMQQLIIARESLRYTAAAPRMAGQYIARRGVATCDDDTEVIVTLQITWYSIVHQ